MRPQRSGAQNRLRQMGIDGVPVYKRVFGEGDFLPPSMVQFFGCRNILIQDVTLKDSPYWVMHPAFCDNVTVRNVTVESYNLNNDGCDPESTTNVLIENCNFKTGDDAIAIKAGRDQDAWRIGQPTENIVIRNCMFNSKCNGLCIGSDMAAGVRNVYMENIKIGKCLSAIYFKSNLDRGGFIENVHVNNVTCDSVHSAFIRFETNYHGARGGYHPTRFNNFLIENVTCVRSNEVGIYAVGIENHPLKNITLKNVDVKSAPRTYTLQYVEGITFDNVHVSGTLLPVKPPLTEVNGPLKTD